MTISTMMTISTVKTISTMMTIVFGRKLEVVHKQVGGYLTRCTRVAASIALNNGSSASQSVTYTGIELLRQHKKVQNVQLYIPKGGQVTDLGLSLKKQLFFLCFSIFKTEKWENPAPISSDRVAEIYAVGKLLWNVQQKGNELKKCTKGNPDLHICVHNCKAIRKLKYQCWVLTLGVIEGIVRVYPETLFVNEMPTMNSIAIREVGL